MIGIRLTPHSQRDLQRISRQLRTVGDAKAIRRELVSGLRAGVKPVERDVKAAARSLPAGGGKSTGLRRRIATAVGIQVRTGGRSAGVKIRVKKSRMGDQAALPQRMNRGQWWHPVFGDRDVWVTQGSRSGWFDRTARNGRADVRRQIQKVRDSIERKLG